MECFLASQIPSPKARALALGGQSSSFLVLKIPFSVINLISRLCLNRPQSTTTCVSKSAMMSKRRPFNLSTRWLMGPHACNKLSSLIFSATHIKKLAFRKLAKAKVRKRVKLMALKQHKFLVPGVRWIGRLNSSDMDFSLLLCSVERSLEICTAASRSRVSFTSNLGNIDPPKKSCIQQYKALSSPCVAGWH